MESSCLAFLSLTLALSVSADQCGMADIMTNQVVCDDMWGYNSNAMITGTGAVQDFAKTVEFCGSQDRAAMLKCYTDRVASCKSEWPQEMRTAMDKSLESFSQAIDDLCSEISVVEENMGCLNGISGDITDCFHTAARQNMGTTTEDNLKDFFKTWERMGRQIEECVRDVTTNRCNSEIGDVLGNFLNGAITVSTDN